MTIGKITNNKLSKWCISYFKCVVNGTLCPISVICVVNIDGAAATLEPMTNRTTEQIFCIH